MDNQIEDRIKKVISAVFSISTDSIHDNISSDNLESWDSLKQLHLISAFEDEFNIRFKEEDIFDMLNFTAIRDNIKNYLKSNDR